MSQREKQDLKKRLAMRYGAAAQGGRGTVVLQGQRRVTVYDCRRILQYSPKEIRLALAKRALSVTGEGLFCPSFSAGTVAVEGLITGVLYVDDEE